MNRYLLAYICFFSVVGAAAAAFMGEISWGDVGMVFLATMVASIGNGVILGRRLRKILDAEESQNRAE